MAVTLVVVHDRWDQEEPYRVLAASDPRMQGLGVINFYLLRWEMENIRREAKSQLGLAKFHVRKLHAIKAHIAFTSLPCWWLRCSDGTAQP
ncbi:MAG: transposase [Limnochordales bacterium]|nr:transposase [Limnochordales bacterium]